MCCGKQTAVIEGAELGEEGAVGLVRESTYLKICLEVLHSAKEHGYAGYSKFDALNSPLLRRVSLNNKWLRLILTQLVNRSPFHVRPLFRVRRSRNPKGIALFARAHLFLYSATGDEPHKNEARNLLQWLLENRAEGPTHASWGYNFVWQNTLFLQGRNEPNCVVSVFAGEAFLHAYRVLGDEAYLRVARDVADFIVKELPVLFSSKDEMAIGYVMRDVRSVVLNINALAGAFLAKVWAHTREPGLAGYCERLVRYIVNRRTPYDAWYYSHPREKSPIQHDNYHTGGILDALLEYFEETGDARYMDVYWKGLAYYQKHLFESDGAPRWMSNRKYPFDVHGAAQGVISFAKAARHDAAFLPQAEKIADWSLANLYRRQTRDFAYRRGRFMTWNYSLMRWCNAWMSRGLGELLTER